MHTFFINTSKKNLTEYEVLFDIHYENKTLVSMDCPIADWYNEETGYLACVRKMGDMIEGYKELNNAFNLILYIDLPENKAYSAIERDEFHDKAREECCRAMHILFTHVISGSIVKALADSGRKPQNVLIMFGEEKEFTQFEVAASSPRRGKVIEHIFGFLGLPDAKRVTEIAKEVDDSNAEDKLQIFRTQIQSESTAPLVPGLRERYQIDLELWSESIVVAGDVDRANEELFDRICRTNKEEEDRIGIEGISCRYDCYASRVNKTILAVSQLNIALHLLQCVEANSVYEEDGKRLLPFHPYTAEEVAPLFKRKELLYAGKAEEAGELGQVYAKLGLTPTLKALNYAKFGLDSHGDRAKVLVETAVTAEPDKKTEKTEETAPAGEATDAEVDGVVSVKANTYELNAVAQEGNALFTKEQYAPFDYCCDAGSGDMLKKDTSPKQYKEQAKKVRMHHLDYLKELRRHISKVLSNYAGKSKENKPALLQVGGFPYATGGNETGVLEDVENTAKTAYDTVMNQYMEFSAGRSVAVTDIEEQCNVFVSRINQIEESMKRIGLVAIGLLVAIFALYIPFLLIQFEAIALNVLTVTVALCSVAIPIVLLYLVFLFVSLAQRKKYLKAWEEFKTASDAALTENTTAARKYDQLLSMVVPSLRWIYEYKLDVDYYAECCTVADAKVEHHRQKLHQRAMAIRNILADLEYQEPEEGVKWDQDEEETRTIDYTVPFCTGKTNRAFYTVIDKQFFRPEN